VGAMACCLTVTCLPRAVCGAAASPNGVLDCAEWVASARLVHAFAQAAKSRGRSKHAKQADTDETCHVDALCAFALYATLAMSIQKSAGVS